MIKINAFILTPFWQGILDILIKAGVALAILVLNYLSAALTNGMLALPYPGLTIPAATLLISQLDAYFVHWQAPTGSN